MFVSTPYEQTNRKPVVSFGRSVYKIVTFTKSARTSAPAALLVATLGLGACSGGAPSSSPSPTSSDTQTVAEACAAVRTSVDDAVAQLQAIDPGDPNAAVTALSGVADRLSAAAGTVGNADVAALLPELQEGFAAASETLTAIAGGDLSQLPKLQQITTDIQDGFTRFAELCTTP